MLMIGSIDAIASVNKGRYKSENHSKRAINDTEPVGLRWVDNHPFPGLPDDWDEPFPETSGDD